MSTWLRIAIATLVSASVAVALAVGLSRVTVDTTPASFLSKSDPAQTATKEVAEAFGGDAIVVLAESKEPAGLLQRDELKHLVGLEGELARLPDVAVVYGPGTVLNQVAGQAQNLLATISGRRDGLEAQVRAAGRRAGLSQQQVATNVSAALRRFDVRYAGLLVRALPAGLPTLSNPSFVRAVVFDKEGEPRSTWRFVVPRAKAVALIIRPRDGMDQASTEDLVAATRRAVDAAGLDTTRVTVAGMPVMAAGLGQVMRREVPLLGGIALALIVACYVLLPWLPRRRHRLLPVAATLGSTALTLALFGWLDHPLSLGVVAFLPILLGTGSDFPAYLVRGADRRKVLVTALAAAVGFAALMVSAVPFVRDLGIALAVGVLFAVGITQLVLAVRPDWCSPGLAVATPAPAASHGPAATRPARAMALVSALAVAAIGWGSLPHLHLQTDPEQLAAGAPGLSDALYAEGVLGSAGEVDLLVRADDVTSPTSLAWMNEVQRTVVRTFGSRLRPIISAPLMLQFLGRDPSPQQIAAGLDQLPPYLRSAVVTDDGRQAVLTFGIGLGDVASQQKLLHQLRKALPTPPAGVELELAGLPVVSGRAYELVSSGRYLDALAGVAGAGLVLLVGLRRRSDAGRAVVAAVLSAGWGLAAALSLGADLSPLTVALGSLATATACEFTVLLGDRSSARPAMRRAVLVAASAATAGYLALAVSGLAVIRDFGLFLAGTVLLSLLAATLVRFALPGRTARPTPVPDVQSVPDLESALS